MAPKEPIALVHIDAHTDTWDSLKGSKFTHGAPFRRAVEAGLLDPERTIQIGIRSVQNSDGGWRYSIDNGMRVVFIEEFDALGPVAIADEARRVVGDAPVYLSLDVDGLGPVFTPGTGTPEISGLTTRETLTLLRSLDGLNWIGGDVVEVSPRYDPSGNTALVAATLMYEMLCLFAKRRVT
jgi:guanidinopropionase